MQEWIFTNWQSHTKLLRVAKESLSVLAELLPNMPWMVESLPVTSGQSNLR